MMTQGVKTYSQNSHLKIVLSCLMDTAKNVVNYILLAGYASVGTMNKEQFPEKDWAYYAVFPAFNSEMIGVTKICITKTPLGFPPVESTIIYPKYPPYPGERCRWIGKLITKEEFDTYLAFGIIFVIEEEPRPPWKS